VDTGAVFTVLPEAIWRRLRRTSERTAEFTMAGGTTITRGALHGRGTDRHIPAASGRPGDAALLGAVTPDTLGLMVHPLSRELLPMPLLLRRARV
jgi:hypothetical protein